MAIELENTAALTFARLGSGALAIGHRPPLRTLARMRNLGITHIATVLSAAENPQAIEAASRAAGLSWLWLPLGSTKILPARGEPEIARSLQDMATVMESKGRIYLHCSAGIHRTGMIAVALMFYLGYDELQIRAALAGLRPVTAECMGTERFDWARSFAAPQPS